MKIGVTTHHNLSSLEQMTGLKGFKGDTKIRSSGGALYGSNSFSGFNKNTRNEKRAEAKQFIAQAFQNTIDNLRPETPNYDKAKFKLDQLKNLILSHDGELRGKEFRNLVSMARDAVDGKIEVNHDKTSSMNNKQFLNNAFGGLLGDDQF